MEARSLCGIGGSVVPYISILVTESLYLGIDDGESFIVLPPLPDPPHYDGQTCPLHQKCLN